MIGGLLASTRRPRGGRAGHQGRHLPAHRASASSTPRAGPCSTRWTARWRGWAPTTSTCGRCTPGATRPPLEETLSALDHAVAHRPRALRRGLELHRLADRRGRRPGSESLARSGAAGLDPGRVLAAAARHRARGAAGRRGARARACCAWSPLGARRADRQVPRRDPGGLPGRVAALRAVRRAVTSTPRSRRIVDAVAPRPTGWTPRPLEVALAWVRDAPGVTAPIVGARTAAQLRARSPPRRSRCRPRSAAPWTRSSAPRRAIPTADGGRSRHRRSLVGRLVLSTSDSGEASCATGSALVVAPGRGVGARTCSGRRRSASSSRSTTIGRAGRPVPRPTSAGRTSSRQPRVTTSVSVLVAPATAASDLGFARRGFRQTSRSAYGTVGDRSMSASDKISFNEVDGTVDACSATGIALKV